MTYATDTHIERDTFSQRIRFVCFDFGFICVYTCIACTPHTIACTSTGISNSTLWYVCKRQTDRKTKRRRERANERMERKKEQQEIKYHRNCLPIHIIPYIGLEAHLFGHLLACVYRVRCAPSSVERSLKTRL